MSFTKEDRLDRVQRGQIRRYTVLKNVPRPSRCDVYISVLSHSGRKEMRVNSTGQYSPQRSCSGCSMYVCASLAEPRKRSKPVRRIPLMPPARCCGTICTSNIGARILYKDVSPHLSNERLFSNISASYFNTYFLTIKIHRGRNVKPQKL